jgi:hypothetical protein
VASSPFAVSIGTAKPDADVRVAAVVAVAICELMPMTRPWASISGPPELPGLIAESVWTTWSMVNPLGPLILRCSAETIPAVIVRSRPNGLPIATTGSPTCSAPERPGPAVQRHLVRVDGEHREVVRVVLAQHAGRHRAALAREPDGHVRGAVDDVGVREDVALAVDREA